MPREPPVISAVLPLIENRDSTWIASLGSIVLRAPSLLHAPAPLRSRFGKQRNQHDLVAALQSREGVIAVFADKQRLRAVARKLALQHLICVFGDGEIPSAV